jgi:protein tyrosine/serine phosphatase
VLSIEELSMHHRVLASLLLIALSAGPTSAILGATDTPASVVSLAPIKRFIQVDHNLYRGAQPDDKGFVFLRDLDIRTVISFRNDDSERKLVESLGMTFVHIPMTFIPFTTDVPDDAVTRFFAVVDDASSGRIFFHCRRGADRTGTFAALYRIARQGWGFERAYKEARDIGLHWWFYPVKGQLQALVRTLQPVPAMAQ